MSSTWPEPGSAFQPERQRDDLREWRWRSYLDHLEDLGYDLGNGPQPDEQVAVGPGVPDRAGAAGSTSVP